MVNYGPPDEKHEAAQIVAVPVMGGKMKHMFL